MVELQEIAQDELIARWQAFFEGNAYAPKIHTIADLGEGSLIIRFGEVDRHDSDLAAFLLRRPLNAITAGEEAIRRLAPPGDATPTVHLRINALPPDARIEVRSLAAKFLGQLVAVEGIVAKAPARKARLTDALFQCLRCGTIIKEPQDGQGFREPLQCYEEQGGCKRSASASKFKLLTERSATVDAQEIDLVDPPSARADADAVGLPVYAVNDLAGLFKRGDRVTVNGILRGRRIDKSAISLEFVLDAISVEAELASPSPAVLVMDLAAAVSIVKTVLDHPDPLFHYCLIFGAAQDHVIDLLHTVFYLVVSGGPDTGKGTANAAAMALCRNGIVLGGASGPYLRDTLGGGRAIAISEFETLLKENPQLLAVIRNGNRRITAKVGLKIPVGNGWMNVEVDTFGFKAMDFHDRLDSHVLGRSLSFEMVRSKNLDVAMDAEYLMERLGPVRAWLAYRADRAKANGWTADTVRETWDSEEFRGRVRTFRDAWGRHGIIAAYLLLLNDIFGFGLADQVRQIMDTRELEISAAAQEVQEAIDELVGPDPKPTDEFRVNDDVLAKVNAIRKARGLPPRTGITGALRELLFSTRSQDWVPAKKNRGGLNRGKAVILPYDRVRTWRSDTPGEKGAKGANGATPHMEDGTLGILGTLPPRPSQVETIATVLNVLRDLCKGDRLAKHGEIALTAAARGLDAQGVAFGIKALKQQGDLYEPVAGTYRLTEALR